MSAERVSPDDLTEMASAFQGSSASVNDGLKFVSAAQSASNVDILGSAQVLSQYQTLMTQASQAVQQIVTSLLGIGGKLDLAAKAYRQFQQDVSNLGK